MAAVAITIGLCTLAASTILSDTGIVMVRDIYGKIPSDFFVFTGPFLPAMNMGVAFDIFYFVVAIVFVSGVESLLCSSMADRLANNKGTPFNPNKEFWGQGLVQVFTPLLNGFPCTGALARTATSIKAGAVTPLAGYFKGVLKLVLAYCIADYLELVPMACIGGILLIACIVNFGRPGPVNSAQAHGAGFTGGVQFATFQLKMTERITGIPYRYYFCMRCRIVCC